MNPLRGFIRVFFHTNKYVIAVHLYGGVEPVFRGCHAKGGIGCGEFNGVACVVLIPLTSRWEINGEANPIHIKVTHYHHVHVGSIQLNPFFRAGEHVLVTTGREYVKLLL